MEAVFSVCINVETRECGIYRQPKKLFSFSSGKEGSVSQMMTGLHEQTYNKQNMTE